MSENPFHFKPQLPNYSLPEIDYSSIVRANMQSQTANYASGFYERLKEYIIEFEKEINEAEEVGARIVSYGESFTIHITDLGFYNPSLIVFYGVDSNNKEVQLIQHISQINILLIKLPRILSKERPRVGFKLSQKDDQKDESENPTTE